MPMMHPALTRRIRKEKEQRTTPGGEQAPVLHPQQHDTVGVLIFDFGYIFRVERFIAIPVPWQVTLMVCWSVY